MQRSSKIAVIFPLFLTACFDESAEKCESLSQDKDKQTLAYTYCEKAAKKGDAKAQVYFAELLFAQNQFEQAVSFLEKSANQHNGLAMFMLGQQYEKGEGVEKDLNKASFYYAQSCKQNELKGCEREHSLKLSQEKQQKQEQLSIEQAKAQTLANEKAKIEAEAKAMEQARLAEEAKIKRQEAEALKAKVGHRKFYYGLAKYQEGDLWGHINPKGEIVIPIQFAYAGDFYDGLSAVKTTEGKWGYIDTSGKYQIQPRFNCAAYFNEGLAAVAVSGYGKDCQGGKWGFIDKDGDWVINPVLDKFILPFRNGVAKVTYGTKTGYINKQGEWVEMDEPQNTVQHTERKFYDGLAKFEQNGKWGYVDQAGKVVIFPRFERAGRFVNGLSAVAINGKWGYINKFGDFVISPQFTCAAMFYEDFAAVYLGGYVDNQDKCVNGKWGFINRSGKMVIQPIFDDVLGFRKGKAKVWLNGETFFIDKSGNRL